MHADTNHTGQESQHVQFQVEIQVPFTILGRCLMLPMNGGL
jgi:hypothetical protein